jgi:hypothetical protein
MRRDEKLEAAIVAKYAIVAPVLNERARRLWAATEARAIGHVEEQDEAWKPLCRSSVAAYAGTTG